MYTSFLGYSEEKVSRLLPLDEKDIIQLDSTIIVGLLILLTLTSIVSENSATKLFYTIGFGGFVLGAILPFSLSVVFVIKGTFLNQPRKKYMAKAVLSTLLGFYYLMGVVVFIVGVSIAISVNQFLDTSN